MSKNKNYVNSKELEEYWLGWELTKSEKSWEIINEMIYKIAEGVSKHFNPENEDIMMEHIHDGYIITIDKIKNGKLRYTPGKAPLFNLLTTTIFRNLYSKMNKNKRRKVHTQKYIEKYILENHEDLNAAVQHGYFKKEQENEI